jgi:hypothetical protein
MLGAYINIVGSRYPIRSAGKSVRDLCKDIPLALLQYLVVDVEKVKKRYQRGMITAPPIVW